MAAAKVQELHPKSHPIDDHDDGDHGDGGHGGGHCPPPWIITFADMVTLLMAFFVILLQTSTPDEPKFNAFASAMRQTFGTVKDGGSGSGIFNGGTSLLNWNAGPQAGSASDDPNGASPKAEGAEGDGVGDSGPGGASASQIAKVLAEALQQGEITMDGMAGPVTVKLPDGASTSDALKLAETLTQALTGQEVSMTATAASAAGGQPSGDTSGQDGGKPGAAAKGETGQTQAEQAATSGPAQGSSPMDSGEGTGGQGGPEQARRMADIATARLEAALAAQIATGDVKVGQRDGKVTVTVGSGGAFASGSADLTGAAQEIMDSVIRSAATSNGQIVVTGHTDNVPISGGKYVDNWDLAAARASAVVRAITETGQLDPSRLVAISKGDTSPVASNDTEEGRAQNRRIEIEIYFDK